MLNVGYLKVVKKSRSGKHPQVLNNKTIVKKKFKDLLCLVVDSVTPQGGSTNTGNTARKSFANVDLFATCLGFNDREKEIIVMFRSILIAISSQLPINPENFLSYCQKVYNMWFDLFEWQPMSPTIHKLLVHGSEIIKASPLPIGVLSEESADSGNKLLKFNRKYHARQSNRIDNLTDMLNNALQISDPFFSCKYFASQKQKKKKTIPEVVIDMLDLTPNQLNGISMINESEVIDNYNDEISYFYDEEYLDEVFLENEFQ